MTISPEPLIYGAIFFGVLLLVEGIYLAIFGPAIRLDRKVNRRLEMLTGGAPRDQVLDRLRKEIARHASGPRIPLLAGLSVKAQKAAIAFSPIQLTALMLGLGLAAYAALTLATGATLPVRAAVAAAMGAGGIHLWVGGRAKKRMALIEEQLPDAVELMVRSLRVGHPFSSAIGIVAREMPDPLGSEMGMIADEAAYGRDIGDALKALAERLDLQDLRFLAVAVTIQQQSGGNLAEILEGLARVIRARFKLFRRVKAITAEAKWSGMFLSGFPLVALVGINVLQPDYYEDVSGTPLFLPACIAVGIFLSLNVLVMRALVNIKV
jgi:tight adherence protein B